METDFGDHFRRDQTHRTGELVLRRPGLAHKVAQAPHHDSQAANAFRLAHAASLVL